MDVRDALNTLAETVPPESELPERTRKGARRRRALNASVTLLMIIAMGAGGWVGVRALRPEQTRIPPAERTPEGVTKLEWFGHTAPFAQTDDSLWLAISPRLYRLADDGTVKGEWRFGNDPLSPNPPPYATIAGTAASSDRFVFVAYRTNSLPDGRDPCVAQPFVAGSAKGCGRVAVIRNGTAEERTVLDEPPTGIVMGDEWAWVSGVSTLYRVTDGDDILHAPVPLPPGLRAVKLLRDATHLWVLTEGPESANVLLKLDARTGAEVARTEVPGSVVGVGAGAVWGAGLEREGARTISTVFRIDTETLRITGPTRVITTFLAGDEPAFTQLGPILADGSDVWVGSHDGIVYRIDADSGRTLGSIRTKFAPATMIRRGGFLWSAHLDGHIVRTPLDPPVTTFAPPEDAPDYVEPSPGPGPSRPAGFTRVDLLGDDRTIVVHFFHGLCDHLDHVAISYEATRVVVRPMIADDPRPPGTACPGAGVVQRSVVRLREPLGDRTIVNAD